MKDNYNIHKGYMRLTMIIIIIFMLFFIDFLASRLFIPVNYDEFRTKHYYYHHTLIPNYSGTAAWGPIYYPMFTNSLGFRDKEIKQVPLKSSAKRILFLGDSQTEAVGMKYEQSFVGILSEKFAEQGIEVLNASAVSYSPRLFYLKTKFLIENVGLEFDTLIVMLDISDMQNEIVYEPFKPGNKGGWDDFKYNLNHFFNKNSFVYYSIKDILKSIEHKRFMEKAQLFKDRKLDISDNIAELYSGFFSDFDDEKMVGNPSFHGVSEWMYDTSFFNLAQEGTRLGKEQMNKLVYLCEKNNIDFIISVHPWQEQVRKRQQTDYFVNSWKTFAREHGVGFINLYPAFINQRNPEAVINDCFIKNDNHWNEKGNKAAAKLLYEILNESEYHE